MALVIPSGYSQVALRFRVTGDSEEMLATFGIDQDDFTGTETDQAQTMAGRWLAQFGADSMGPGYTFVGVTVRQGHFTEADTIGEHLDNVVGTDLSQNLPVNCAILVKKLSGVGGRANRGRMYLPPAFVGENVVDAAGNIGAPTVAVLQAKLDAFFDGTGFVILHDSSSPVSTPTRITSVQVDSKIATQRRRLR